jgi:hypothetical protein
VCVTNRALASAGKAEVRTFNQVAGRVSISRLPTSTHALPRVVAK